MVEPLIFLGAGASQPFGIPTMEGFVPLFSELLEGSGSPDEKELYAAIIESLGPSIDLEAVFSLINMMTEREWNSIHLNPSLFFYKRYRCDPYPPILDLPIDGGKRLAKDLEVVPVLKERLEKYVRNACEIRDEFYEKIYDTYSYLFNNLAHTINLPGSRAATRGNQKILTHNWPIFTTNYDLCVEEFCREYGIKLNIGVGYDQARRLTIVSTNLFNPSSDEFSLVKLHGSLRWVIQDDGTLVQHEGGKRTYGLHEVIGDVMVFPIRQKDMYVDPYLDMIYYCAKKLKRHRIWLVIGYQFNYEILRTMFEEYSSEDKWMILVDPKASSIKNNLGLKCKIKTISKKFGSPETTMDITNFIKDLL